MCRILFTFPIVSGVSFVMRFPGLRLTRYQFLVLIAAQALLSYPAHALVASANAAPILVANDLGKGTVPLDGPWQFHLGDNPAWAAPSLDDSPWEQLTADQTWGAQSHPSYVGFAWYRRHIDIVPAPGAPPDIALLIPAVDDAYDLYWNGQLVAHVGKLPPYPVWYPFLPPQTFGLGAARSGVLALRVWKAPLGSNDTSELGGFEGLPLIGSPQAIAAVKGNLDFQWLRSRQIDFALTSLYGLVSFFSFLAWLRDRKQWLLFWMAGYTFSPFLAQILSGSNLPLPGYLALGLLQPTLMLQDISLWFVLLWLLELHNDAAITRFTRNAAIVFCVAFSLDGIAEVLWGILPPHFVQICDAILTTIFTPLELLPIVLVIAAVLRHSQLDYSRWAVAICAFIAEMIFVVRNAASQGVRYTHWHLTDKLNAPLFTLFGNPISPRILASMLLLVAIANAVVRSSIENRRRQNAIEQELQNARELQQVLVPETLPNLPGFTLTSAYRPAQEVGGDFFQIIPLEGGSALIFLGDVSGKGLKAAMAVSLIVGAARMVAEFTRSPAEILSGLNRRLYGRLQGGFATCVVMRLDPDGGCTIASAGHPAPFLNDGELPLPGALPLGITAAITYEESTFNLQIGDHFALYTDGLLEARSQAGELYGFARLRTLFATRPGAAQAAEAAVHFGQDDDITVLALTRLKMSEQTSLTQMPVPSQA